MGKLHGDLLGLCLAPSVQVRYGSACGAWNPQSQGNTWSFNSQDRKASWWSFWASSRPLRPSYRYGSACGAVGRQSSPSLTREVSSSSPGNCQGTGCHRREEKIVKSSPSPGLVKAVHEVEDDKSDGESGKAALMATKHWQARCRSAKDVSSLGTNHSSQRKHCILLAHQPFEKPLQRWPNSQIRAQFFISML